MAVIDATPPPILYHYTRLPGLLGIIDSKALWATDIRYLNDETEFHHAVDITRDLLTELKDFARRLRGPRSFLPFWREWMP